MHRNTRLTEIVRFVRAHGRVSAEQIAEHFQVSPRTIYRDMALLNRMDVPVIGEPGIGYHLDPTARLGVVQFTTDELEAIFTSAKKSMATAEVGAADAIVRAMVKVKEALPDPLVEAFGEMDLPTPKVEEAS